MALHLPSPANLGQQQELRVLMLIAAGLIAILLAVVLGLFITARPGMAVPNWAENVLVGIASVTGLRLGDCLSALVQLALGRQNARLGEKLAEAPPPATITPAGAGEAADAVADAAADKADQIKGGK